MERLYTKQKAAELLGFHPNELDRLVASKRIRAKRVMSARSPKRPRRMFTASEIERFITSQPDDDGQPPATVAADPKPRKRRRATEEKLERVYYP